MLSYQHIYHAANFADVHKHLWLICVIDYLLQKDKPFTWIDTHAGRGLYDLQAAEAQKLKEYEDGFSALDALPTSLLAERYKSLMGDRRFYSGSAVLAAKMLRGDDRLIAHELHSGEFAHLQKALKPYKNARALHEDGYKGLNALVPPAPRRGGVLLDPSYEVKSEYETCAKAVLKAYKKWSQGVYMIWYPILGAGLHRGMIEVLSALGLDDEKLIVDEWQQPGKTSGMTGSGIIVINPPYGCAEQMRALKV